MPELNKILDRLDWMDVSLQLDVEGFAVLPGVLGTEVARGLAQQVTASGIRRVTLESNDLGRGEMLYFDTGLPAPLETWRTALYRRLVVIANRWNETLDIDYRYPVELDNFLQHNQKFGQTRRQSHLNRLGVDDQLSLHQRNNGELLFPMQIVALVTESGSDFEGGEFVITEQRPRMQSRPMVVPLKLGDLAIITTAERPFRGTKGYYRVNLKHAISRVRRGERIGLELSFHDSN